MRARSRNRCWHEEAINITCYECLWPLLVCWCVGNVLWGGFKKERAYVWRNMRAHSRNRCWHEETINITCYECLWPLLVCWCVGNVLWGGFKKRVYVWRNMRARSRNRCWHEEAINITCYECLCLPLLIQHAKRMRYIILSSVTCPSV